MQEAYLLALECLTNNKRRLKQLTANVNLQFAEACYHVPDRKLHDEVSVSRQARGTLQVRKHVHRCGW